ncbi:hypothetical protein Taro_020737 [Colocasia esculenta]|uniref:Secreted protein n=1 Tax=Colocasia esculenta TaxID=4460 RepID=A0A843UZJ2_COLES|nr:hypothetical protein [Colocasia esculenta]
MEFPTVCTFHTVLVVRLLSSGRACAGRRRWGGCRGPRSYQWFPFSVRLLSSGRARAGRRRRGGSPGPRS